MHSSEFFTIANLSNEMRQQDIEKPGKKVYNKTDYRQCRPAVCLPAETPQSI